MQMHAILKFKKVAVKLETEVPEAQYPYPQQEHSFFAWHILIPKGLGGPL